MSEPTVASGLMIRWVRLESAAFRRIDSRSEKQIAAEEKHEADPSTTIEYQVSVRVIGGQEDDENQAIVGEQVQANSYVKGVHVWQAECVMAGFFRYTPNPALDRDSAFKVNAGAILYPYCREFLGDILRRAGANVVLPPMRFAQPMSVEEPREGRD